MKVTGIELINVRGFKHLERTELSTTINVFVGPNNSGKSTIINSIYILQNPNVLQKRDITIGEQNGEIRLYVKGNYPPVMKLDSHSQYILKMLTGGNLQINRGQLGNSSLGQIPPKEPENLIYPYLSKRKVASFNDAINDSVANSITGNFSNLFAKIDRLVTPEFQPANSEYLKACDDILSFRISSIASSNGKQAVYFIRNNENITLSAMGDGVVNILGLITDLCVAENKIFLIEEPENDIHPKALKLLLDLIIEKSVFYFYSLQYCNEAFGRF
ncbi:MAG: AAA family ATPase [Candidatus Neomarinimicrobiota bacterium]